MAATYPVPDDQRNDKNLDLGHHESVPHEIPVSQTSASPCATAERARGDHYDLELATVQACVIHLICNMFPRGPPARMSGSLSSSAD
jgi:hypothetical protein